VGIGFMMYALKYDQTKLKHIVIIGANSSVLAEALRLQGFSKVSASIIAENPQKMLWPELLQFFKGKTIQTVDNCT
jgi:hypothetical protein